ncbi:transposase, partial [Arthrobacter flavus]
NQLDALDTLIAERFREHHQAEVMLSMPGFGPLLGAEFLGAIGGDLSVFDSVDRLAGVAGLALAPKDSGRIRGNHHRPRRYDRRLLRACYMAAMSSLRSSTASRTYYDRKRAEGKTHVQSVLSLARRRLNVLWAMLRDGTVYKPPGDLVPLPA